ncbi:MAG: hypothetical protein M1835_004404 [Candelina submexicana]|nr:MAG: hypothetical protein M1835_004404 [Candelina submexicana]
MALPRQHETSSFLARPLRFITGASWLYPFKGIYYFVAHPFLYPLLRARLLPCFLLSLFVLVNLFLWTYLPQVAFLAIFHGPLAWVNAAFLVLGEGAAIVALLFEAFLVDETLVDVFDAVLLKQGFEELIADARVLDEAGNDPVQRLGKLKRSAVYSPFSFRQIAEFIVLLPLNLIPIAGTPLFLILTGYRAGPLHHWRYFKLREFVKKEKKSFIRRRRLRYTWFGTIALILQLVPVLSMFFLLTTAAGSALWVADLEEQRRQQEAQQVVTPEYADDPV